MDAKSMKGKDLFIDLENGLSESDQEGVDSLDNSPTSIGCLLDERVGHGGKAGIGSSREKTRRKHSKPPRPPKSPSLVADQSLARAISEHSMLKRSRLERMKALKEMKKSRTTSSNGCVCALVVTLVFFAIIIWQGLFSKSSSSFPGSAELVHKFHGNSSTRPLHYSVLKRIYFDQGKAGAIKAAMIPTTR